MTGTNHALTGALIGFSLGNPILVAPVAFASHFLLDTLPHFGEKFGKRKLLSKSIWLIDAVLLGSFLVFLLLNAHWIMLLGAVVAISPDFAWVYRFVIAEKCGRLAPGPTHVFNQFHAGIQKLETRKGLIAEILWFAVFFYLNREFAL